MRLKYSVTISASVVNGLAGVSGTNGLVAVGAVVGVDVPGVDAACDTPSNATEHAEAQEDTAALATLVESTLDTGLTLELAVVAGDHAGLHGPNQGVGVVPTLACAGSHYDDSGLSALHKGLVVHTFNLLN